MGESETGDAQAREEGRWWETHMRVRERLRADSSTGCGDESKGWAGGEITHAGE